MACCCGPTGGSVSSLPILTGPTDPVAPPDLTQYLPLYRNLTTGELWVWYGGAWAVTQAPLDWMKAALAGAALQPTDFITINRGGSPGSPFSGTYYVATVQDLASAVGAIVGATTVSSGSPAITVTVAGNDYAVGLDPQGAATQIASDPAALGTLFGAATLSLLSDVSASTPNVNDALVWNGSQWAPVPLSALTNDSFVNGGSITGGGTTLTLTYNTTALPPININVANIVPNYDNTASGLTSTNMQAAIDELAAMFGGSFINIGTGEPVYAGYVGGQHQFHSVDGANGVAASIQGSTIVLQFDPGSLTPVALQQFATMLAADATSVSTIAGAIRLGDLADVNTTGAANGEVLTYQGGVWVPAQPPAAAGGGQAVEEVLQGICAECLDDAIAQGLQPGDYFLQTGSVPPRLFQWDGANLTAVNPLPDIFVCCNSRDVWVQCNGEMVGTWAVGDDLAHQVMNVICAASQTDAVNAGLQAHQYWLDVSVTPPQLMHYNGVTSQPAGFVPRLVICCNSGDVYRRCLSGANPSLEFLGSFGGGGTVPGTNVTITACPSGPITTNTNVQDAICALSGFSVVNLSSHAVALSLTNLRADRYRILNRVFTRFPFDVLIHSSGHGFSVDLATGIVTLDAGIWAIQSVFHSGGSDGFFVVRDAVSATNLAASPVNGNLEATNSGLVVVNLPAQTDVEVGLHVSAGTRAWLYTSLSGNSGYTGPAHTGITLFTKLA